MITSSAGVIKIYMDNLDGYCESIHYHIIVLEHQDHFSQMHLPHFMYLLGSTCRLNKVH